MEPNDVALYVAIGMAAFAFIFMMLSEIRSAIKDSGCDDVLDEIAEKFKE